MPMSLITRDLLPPWMSFYEKKAIFNLKTNSISKKSLTELRRLKWSEEKIIAFNQYRIESRNRNTPLEYDLDDVFKYMWRLEHPSNTPIEEYPKSNDEEEEQEQSETQATGQEE